jgi:hypothetical protein
VLGPEHYHSFHRVLFDAVASVLLAATVVGASPMNSGGVAASSTAGRSDEETLEDEVDDAIRSNPGLDFSPTRSDQHWPDTQHPVFLKPEDVSLTQDRPVFDTSTQHYEERGPRLPHGLTLEHFPTLLNEFPTETFRELLHDLALHAIGWSVEICYMELGGKVLKAIRHPSGLSEEERKDLTLIDSGVSTAEWHQQLPPESKFSFGKRICNKLRPVLRRMVCGRDSLIAVEADATVDSLMPKISEALFPGRGSEILCYVALCFAKELVLSGVEHWCDASRPEETVDSADAHSSDADVSSALLGLAQPQQLLRHDLFRDLDAAVKALSNVPWRVLDGLRGDADILKQIDNAEGLLQRLRKTLSP